jgi:hypothetical protein
MAKFEAGKSGNPGGRPKSAEGVKDLARMHTKTAIAALVRVIEDKKANPSARVSAAVAILDRGWGKPVQAIAGANGEDPIELVHRVERVIVRPAGSDS